MQKSRRADQTPWKPWERMTLRTYLLSVQLALLSAVSISYGAFSYVTTRSANAAILKSHSQADLQSAMQDLSSGKPFDAYSMSHLGSKLELFPQGSKGPEQYDASLSASGEVSYQGKPHILIASHTTSELDQFTAETRSNEIKRLAILLAALLVATGFSSMNITDDISQMRRAVRDVRSGKRSKIPEIGSIEMQEFAETLNLTLNSLQHQLNSREQFNSDLGHEIRTPLTSIKGHADLLGRRWQTLPDDIRQEAIDTIRREVERLGEMVTQMLQLSRAEQGKLELKHEPLSIAGIADEIQGLLTDIAIHAEAATIESDSGAIRQILLNLIRNARNAGASNAWISLGEEGAGTRRILIANDGPAIPPEHHEAIFERLRRLDSARNRHQDRSGAGLGLTISRRLAQELGGNLELSSSDEARTVFTLSLPLERPQGKTKAKQESNVQHG